MDRRKKFDAPAPMVVATTPISEVEGGAVVHVEANPSCCRTIDLSKWLNRGIDDWVWVCSAQLRTLLHGQSLAPMSVIGYGYKGLPYFFEFLTSGGSPCRPAELNRRTMNQFVAWLNDKSMWKLSSKNSAYAMTKGVLIGLQARGVIPGDRSIYPPNPFPGTAASRKGESPLSPTERTRFAEALRKDIIAIHKGRFEGAESQALTVHALALAIRTGLNPTPLLELRRDSLKSHPFMPTMMILESFKRRSNSTHLKNLRFSLDGAQSTSVPMDGVALFNKVLERTKALADSVPINQSDRVWLYVTEGTGKGKLTTLRSNQLTYNTRAIIDRHDLRADDGQRLRMNVTRLRKTMENRLWLLSNGDLFTVAAIMGHTPEVADTHYLACTNEMRKNATFVGEALPDIYRGLIGKETPDQKVIQIQKLENTPVGSCKDSLFGEMAPKDGTTHCSDFFKCFACHSYAIVGTPRDLHRLFSFYWYLDAERQRSRSREWGEQFMETMSLIDSFTLDKFDPAVVVAAKEKAQVEPLKFWKSYQLEEERMVEHGTT